MEDSNSKSLEKVLAQQRQKAIAADDYSHKIESWLKLADQMLGDEATAEKPLSRESTRRNANQKR